MRENAISIVIPAYNEARRLGDTLSTIVEYIEGRFRMHEIIIVDDGSRDRTAEAALWLSESRRDIKVLRQSPNRGKGAALQRGVLESTGEYVLCTDADLSTPIEEIEKLFPRLQRDGYDVAIGSRKLKTSRTVQPLHRRLFGDLSNLFIRLMLGLPFRDTQCGFKLFRRNAAVRLFKPLKMQRFSYDFEVLLRAQKLGMHVAEVGVRWTHSPQTTVTARDAVQSFFDVFRVRFGLTEEFGSPLPSLELLKFMAVGVVNTLVDAGVYVALTRAIAIFAGAPVTAKFFSFVCATISSLILNRYWTFDSTSSPCTSSCIFSEYTTCFRSCLRLHSLSPSTLRCRNSGCLKTN
ncbi:MAG: UDP-glucose-undecaprenyl-phosphate glucosyltransferase [Candidatus Adlerbacteria bacterium GW2011_GWB1_54_7]|uniref:dolichyl-phosphate beta-glucosyltransferase n=1 Tax=Candidatus Adlerbacteria bacterium GW2011_GWB1_54_7 TaxID=1618607 RepID=A0A0G2A901_9BACT|nr:MAG: UDP-glucose-undecaprenyl-phosphate glucosyltransferase [Candidatus Adlerbacteria bacterium GW2011_GWB1_54_7]